MAVHSLTVKGLAVRRCLVHLHLAPASVLSTLSVLFQVGLEHTGGPRIPFRPGRVDYTDESAPTYPSPELSELFVHLPNAFFIFVGAECKFHEYGNK